MKVYNISEMYKVPAIKEEFILLWISLLKREHLVQGGQASSCSRQWKERAAPGAGCAPSGWYPRGLHPGCCGHGQMEKTGFGGNTSLSLDSEGLCSWLTVPGFQVAEVNCQETHPKCLIPVVDP